MRYYIVIGDRTTNVMRIDMPTHHNALETQKMHERRLFEMILRFAGCELNLRVHITAFRDVAFCTYTFHFTESMVRI